MANGGGGIIVYGVEESQKAATRRVDVGELSEADERAYVSAAITAIAPPVFGLVVHRLGTSDRTVVVEVPASLDGPHFIYRGEYFGAPVRNGPDTVWMKERQIEVMYRARFDERRRTTEALDQLFADAATGRDYNRRAWLIAVAHPRIPRVAGRLSRDGARGIMTDAVGLALHFVGRGGFHPIESVERLNPRPGLRRWVFVNAAITESSAWKESWASIHHDGSVTLATKIGGHRFSSDGYLNAWELTSNGIECAVADLMALVRATARAVDTTEYDVRVAIRRAGTQPMIINLGNGETYGGSVPIRHFTPVETTIDASEPDLDYYWNVHDLAADCVNQGGIPEVTMIRPPARPD